MRLLSALLALAPQDSPPPFTPCRYDEEPALRSDPPRTGWERLARVPLGARGSTWLATGLELRLRFESYRNDAWSPAPEADHDYLWWRALPFVALESPHARVFTQLIAAGESGDEAGTTSLDEDRADVLQAFGELRRRDRTLALRAGRQLLSFGSERLIGPRYGPNVLQAFDCARLSARRGGWQLDGFLARPVEVRTGTFDDRSDDARALAGLYAARAPGTEASLGLEAYVLGLHDDEADFEEGAGAERRVTVGTRGFGARAGWDWNVELFAQGGRFAGGDVRAWSVASDWGRALALAGIPARLGLKADAISGDDEAGDGELGTFNPLFPKGKYFGESGLLGPYNLLDLHPSLALELGEAWALELGAVLYWRESAGDGLYDNGGNLLRASGASSERFAGTQLDATLAWQVDRNLDLSFSASFFDAGAFLADTGPAEDVGFVSLELRWRY